MASKSKEARSKRAKQAAAKRAPRGESVTSKALAHTVNVLKRRKRPVSRGDVAEIMKAGGIKMPEDRRYGSLVAIAARKGTVVNGYRFVKVDRGLYKVEKAAA